MCFYMMTDIILFFLAGGMCCPRLSPPHLHLEFPLFSPALLQISIHVPRSLGMRQVLLTHFVCS